MLIQVQSMTDAVRIKKILAAKGMRANVVQTPSGMRRGGCGYSVQIPETALSMAEQAARAAGVRILGVQRSGGG